MRAFVSADELVGKRQARHEAPLLEPEDGGKRAGKEYTLDAGECNEADAEWLGGELSTTELTAGQLTSSGVIYFSAQSAFFWIHGTVREMNSLFVQSRVAHYSPCP
jgi:hypothetical protein